MALSAEHRRQLLAAELPDSQAVRDLLQDYLSRTGLVVGDFARRIGYSVPSLNNFIAGRYEKVSSTDRAIRHSIVDFIGANPIGGDGTEDDSDDKLYATEDLRLLRRYFHAALDKGLAYYVYGPPGTQKTFIVKKLIHELNRAELAKNGLGRRAVRVYCRSGIRPTDLMKRVAEAAGVITSGAADRILRNFRFDMRGRRSLIVFDEAQHLNNECLETVRELLDEPPHSGLLFLGSHNLKQIFEQYELEQWRSRLHAGKSLPGISEHESKLIIVNELGPVSPKKVDAIIRGSRVADPRQGDDYSYISARKLFWSLRDIKADLAEHDADGKVQ